MDFCLKCAMCSSLPAVSRVFWAQVRLDDANLTLLLIVRFPFTGLGDTDRIYLRLAGESDVVIYGKCFQCARDQQGLCVGSSLGPDWK